MTREEAAWVRRAVRGDREAFDCLIAPRWERMFRIALRVVGDGEEARDVAQNACLRLWQTLDRFRESEDLDAWIYRMVVNLAIDATRRRKARPVVRAGGEEGTGVAEPQSGEPGPEELLLRGELERALDELSADLPPRQKAAFVLTCIEGMSATEAATVLGVAPSTVRNQVLQARGVLSRRLVQRYPRLAGRPAGERDEDDA